MSDADACAVKRWVVQRTTVENVPLVTQVTIAEQKKRARSDGKRDQRKPDLVIRARVTCSGCSGSGWVKSVACASAKEKDLRPAAEQLIEKIMLQHAVHHAAAVSEARAELHDGDGDGCSADSPAGPVSSCEPCGGEGGGEGDAAYDAEPESDGESRGDMWQCASCTLCANHKGQASFVAKRKGVAAVSSEMWDSKSAAERKERSRALNHEQRGLVGWVRYWACGSMTKVIVMLVGLVKHFGAESEVLEHMLKHSECELATQLRTESFMIKRYVDGLWMLQGCRSTQQRDDYYTGLSLVAPPPAEFGDQSGMGHNITERLRSFGLLVRRQGRPWQQAVSNRAAADAAFKKEGTPLRAGEQAISRGRSCTVVQMSADGSCKLSFSAEGIEATRDFKSAGRGKGGARLARIPVSMRAPAVAQRSDEKSSAAASSVREFCDLQGARSPSTKDRVRRWVGAGLYEVCQALIIFSTTQALFSLFKVEYPGVAIGFTVFKSLMPWYIRRAKRETCLCKACENFKHYQQVPPPPLPALLLPRFC